MAAHHERLRTVILVETQSPIAPTSHSKDHVPPAIGTLPSLAELKAKYGPPAGTQPAVRQAPQPPAHVRTLTEAEQTAPREKLRTLLEGGRTPDPSVPSGVHERMRRAVAR